MEDGPDRSTNYSSSACSSSRILPGRDISGFVDGIVGDSGRFWHSDVSGRSGDFGHICEPSGCTCTGEFERCSAFGEPGGGEPWPGPKSLAESIGLGGYLRLVGSQASRTTSSMMLAFDLVLIRGGGMLTVTGASFK